MYLYYVLDYVSAVQLLGSHTYSVRAFCFGRRVYLSVCLSVPHQIAETMCDTR